LGEATLPSPLFYISRRKTVKKTLSFSAAEPVLEKKVDFICGEGFKLMAETLQLKIQETTAKILK